MRLSKWGIVSALGCQKSDFVSALGGIFNRCTTPAADLSSTVNIPKTQNRFKLTQITTAQIIKIVKKLVNSKATGVHNIPSKVLKDSIDIIAPMLRDIFNLSIKTSS